MKRLAGAFWRDFEKLADELQAFVGINPDLWSNTGFCNLFDDFHEEFKLLDADNATEYALKLKKVTESLGAVVKLASNPSNQNKLAG